MADKKISELDSVLQMNNDAVLPFSQENGGEDTTFKILITALGAKIVEDLTFSNLSTTEKKIVKAINEIRGIYLTGTLTAGSTSLVFSDNSITTDSMVDVYTDKYGVSPSNITVATGSITLDFPVQSQNIGVKVVIK